MFFCSDHDKFNEFAHVQDMFFSNIIRDVPVLGLRKNVHESVVI